MTADGPVDGVPAGLPGGVIDLARSHWRAAERAVGRHHPTERDDAALTSLLLAPLRLEPDWPAPTPPRPVGRGWVHDEVTDDDRAAFEAAAATTWADLGPEALAAASQELRFPVVPYRPLPRLGEESDRRESDRQDDDREHGDRREHQRGDGADRPDPVDCSQSLVVDLSTHWAGPLATKLLAEAGARVVKVDPDCRPDGFRTRRALYHDLNGTKEVVDLDLRRRGDRDRFERLLRGADLVVESFSRRVMGNLGYDPATLFTIEPRLSLLSIKAFPVDTPEQDWLAYGPGVHATSGLGLIGPEPRPAPVAYADFLAGLSAFRLALRLLSESAVHAEVALAAAIAPLVRLAARRCHRTRSDRRDGEPTGG